jgi:hypothetical protein
MFAKGVDTLPKAASKDYKTLAVKERSYHRNFMMLEIIGKV